MTAGDVVRLRWAVTHPSGQMMFRDDVVVVEEVDDTALLFRWMDGVGARILLADVLEAETVAAA